MNNVLVAWTTLPDPVQARTLARHLVENRLAACVQLLPGLTSCYVWQGEFATADETLLLIKTTTDAFPALRAAVCAGHPYELPELVAVPASDGLPAYLDWVASQCGGPQS